MASIVSRETLVPLGLVLSVIGALLGGAWAVNDAKHAIDTRLVVIDTRLAAIQTELLRRTDDRWREGDMKHWAELLKAHNPELVIPDPVAQEVE